MQYDNYRLDGHKLTLHPRRVADWLEGKKISPLYLEMSPSGNCNHRCTFCAMDFRQYRQRFLPADALAPKLSDLGARGVKAIHFSGEGEPFLNPEMPRLAAIAKDAGIDVAFSSNGVLLTPKKAEEVLPLASWIKISCAAGTAQTYAAIHRTKPDDFEHVFRNLEAAVSLRARHGYSCTLGMQMLLLPENRDEAVILARKAADIGLDYLVFKPFMELWQRDEVKNRNISYADIDDLAAAVEECATARFQVFFRREAMRHSSERSAPYARCLAIPFAMFVDSAGDVWGCCRNVGVPAFYFGNLLTQSVDEILNSAETEEKISVIENSYDISKCYKCCRTDLINRYLWELRHPGKHVNFI